MKKTLFISFFIFISTFNFAQSKFRIGVVAGPNYATLWGPRVPQNIEPTYGFLLGGSVNYQLSKSFSLNANIAYERKAADYNSSHTYSYFDSNAIVQTATYTLETRTKYNYLSMPIVLRFQFGKNKSWFVNGGGFMALMIGDKSKTKFSDNEAAYNDPDKSDRNFPWADNFHNFDYGISFGVGKTFRIDDKNSLSVELKDNLGFANQVRNLQINGYQDDIRTDAVSLIFGWSFGL